MGNHVVHFPAVPQCRKTTLFFCGFLKYTVSIMIAWMPHVSRKHITVVTLLAVGVCTVAGVWYTSWGRIAWVYIAHGWQAPWSVQSQCRSTSMARVRAGAPFTDNTHDALYWHAAFYRECLHNAGYRESGDLLPQSTLYSVGTTDLWYVNTLAGAYLRVPPGTVLRKDNELDVTRDPERLHSELMVASTTLALDVYGASTALETLDDLRAHLPMFLSASSTGARSTESTTASGIPFLAVEEADGVCGVIAFSEDKQVLHLYAPCANRTLLHTLMSTLKPIRSLKGF